MRVRHEHWENILDICQKNPELVTNKFNGPYGEAKGQALWQNVAHTLNSLGFGEKSVEDWRKAFTDWKCKTKAKAAKIKLEINQTGGGSANCIPLSELELRLLQLMGKKAVEGDSIQELGFGKVTIQMSSNKEEIASDLYEHSYSQKENLLTDPIPSCSNSTAVIIQPNTDCAVGTHNQTNINNALKRTWADTGEVRKRVKPKLTQKLSHKLVDIHEESVHLLRTISKHTESMADSLKVMAAAMQMHFNDKTV